MGWGTKDVDVAAPMNKYTMFNFNGEEFGGVIPLPDPNAPIHWLPYVSVEDVDQVTRRVEALGLGADAPSNPGEALASRWAHKRRARAPRPALG